VPDWQVVFENQPGALLRVWGTSSTDVYVVGANGDGHGNLFFHYDGSSWKRIDTMTQETLWWIQGITPRDIRIVGDGGVVLSYDPMTGAIQKRQAPDGTTLFGAWGCAQDDVWYVGGDASSTHGVVWRDDNATIHAPAVSGPRTSSTTVFKVHGLACDDVWMVGARGLAMHWNGASFDHPPPAITTGLPLFALHGLESNRLFAVGGGAGGILLAWDGASWKNETPAGTQRMNGVWVAADGTAYAAGFNGKMMKRDSAGWAALDTNPNNKTLPVTFDDLHSVWVDEKNGIWAVGGRLDANPPTDGVLIHYGASVSTTVE
jgi:hypothetical protein